MADLALSYLSAASYAAVYQTLNKVYGNPGILKSALVRFSPMIHLVVPRWPSGLLCKGIYSLISKLYTYGFWRRHRCFLFDMGMLHGTHSPASPLALGTCHARIR